MDADIPVPGPDTPPAALVGVRFRAAEPGDAAGLLALKQNLDRETSFMLLEPGERSESGEDIASDLSTVAGTINSTVIVAETAGQLIGYVDARGGRFGRNRITAHVVIGVLAAASGHGVGSRLLGNSSSGLWSTRYTGSSLRSWHTTAGPGNCMNAWASPSRAVAASAYS